MGIKSIELEMEDGKKVNISPLDLTPKLRRKVQKVADIHLAKVVTERITEPKRM